MKKPLPSNATVRRLLGKNLRQSRIDAGLSLEQLADILGKTKAWVKVQESAKNRIDTADFVGWSAQCRMAAWRNAIDADLSKKSKA